MKYFLLGLLFLFSSSVFAQTVNCNSAKGTVTFPGTSLTVTCPVGTPLPPPVTNPPVTTPVTQPSGPCLDSQLSTSVSGKTFKRQCSGQVFILPGSTTYVGALTDLGTVLGNKPYPTYAYNGFSPTFQIQSGYYVSLAFTPNATGAIQLVANPSYGDGGFIGLSTSPGGLTRGSPGVVCVLSYGGSNSMYVSTNAPICPVKSGQTYYVNFADTDNSGNQLCYGGAANSCSTSYVSYTLYTSK